MRTLALLLLVALAGCAVPLQHIEYQTKFSPAEYSKFDRTGTGVITGQAFMRTRGGEVRTCAGNEVTLDPTTVYSQEWWDRAAMDWRRHSDGPPDPRFQIYRKRTTCNAQGSFKFEHLPAGSYYIRTSVTWETGGQYVPTQGGLMGDRFTISDGETKEIVLAQ